MMTNFRAPKEHTIIKILLAMVSGISFILGLGTRMSDPYVYVVFWDPKLPKPFEAFSTACSIAALLPRLRLQTLTLANNSRRGLMHS